MTSFHLPDEEESKQEGVSSALALLLPPLLFAQGGQALGQVGGAVLETDGEVLDAHIRNQLCDRCRNGADSGV